MEVNYTNTYWNHKGKYPILNDQLTELIPESGPISNFPGEPERNKALETYRIATNCYYDLYNNGLCNLRGKFERVFEFIPGTHDELDQDTIDRTETRMDEIILAAYAEQFHTTTAGEHGFDAFWTKVLDHVKHPELWAARRRDQPEVMAKAIWDAALSSLQVDSADWKPE